MSFTEIATNTGGITFTAADAEVLVDPGFAVHFLGMEGGGQASLVNDGAIGPADGSKPGFASLFANEGLQLINVGSVTASLHSAMELGTVADGNPEVDGTYTVQNSGSIVTQSASDYGIQIGAGQGNNIGLISNAATGMISSTETAVSSAAKVLTVINAGYIAGLSSDGVDETGSLTLTNTGTIFGAVYAISVLGTGSIANHGQISGNIFISGDTPFESILNDGSIRGFIDMGGTGTNTITNAGYIDGTILVEDGTLNYDGQRGTITGTIEGSFAGADTLLGGAGQETFLFKDGRLTSDDTVDGGGGNNDRIEFNSLLPSVTISPSQFANVSHIEQILLSGAANSFVIPDALVSSADDNHLLTVIGGVGADKLDARQVTTSGNHVALMGANGADMFFFTAAGLAGNTVNGGSDAAIDSIVFTTAGTINFQAYQNVSHVEQIVLANGTNNTALTDALVGSADDSHVFYVSGGSGNDTVNGAAVVTAANRIFFTAGAGNDTLTGGAGADTFYFTAVDLTAADTVNGGGSTDRIVFTTAGTVAAAAFQNVSHIEQLILANGANSVTLSNALVSAADGHVLTVTGGTGADTINAAAVTTASNSVHVSGGGGADVLTAGSGADVFAYALATDSSSTAFDTITSFNFAADRFDTPGAPGAITLIEAARSGQLDSGANFDTELAARFSTLAAHHAGLLTVTSGGLNGQTFLVVDLNGTAGYQPNADLVIHLVSTSGTLATGDFI